MAGVRVPVVPFAHEYLVTQPFRERDDGHLPTLRDPDLLVYYREEGGGLVMGGYERHSAPWSLRPDGLDAIAPDFNGILLEEDWDRFEEIAVNSRRRVPAMEDVKVTRLINGPEAFTPDNEFLLGESEVARLLRRRGLLRARAGRRRRPGQGDGRVDRRRRAGDGPVGDGRPALRRALPLAELHAQAHARGLRDLLRHQVPRPRARGRPPAAGLERLRLAPRPRRGLRREVGLGARELVRVQRAGGRRGAAPARLGGPAVVAGDRRRARRLPRARGALRRVLVRQDRGGRPGRRGLPGVAVRQPRRARRRADHLHADAQRPRRASSATSPSRASRTSCSRSSPARPSATTTSSWIRRNAPGRRLGARERRDLALGVLRALGPARPRRARAADARPARLRLHDDARPRGRRRAGARAARDLHRRAGLGALLPDRVRRRRCGGRCGRPASRTASRPAATGRSTRCAWRRATACGRPTSRPTRRRTRPAWASASQGQGRSPGATR